MNTRPACSTRRIDMFRSCGVDQLEAKIREARDLITAADRYDTQPTKFANALSVDLRNQFTNALRRFESLREEADELKDEAEIKRTRAARHHFDVPHLETLTAYAVQAHTHIETDLDALTDE